MNLFEVFFRVLITYSVLLIMARINGPKQIAQMSFYDYISGITVGSIAATISINSSVSFLAGLTAIVLYLGASLVINIITQENQSSRFLFTGKALTLIQKGNIQWDNLRKSKMSISELLSCLRYAGYFNINDVYQAVLETSGKLSVQSKGSTVQIENGSVKKNQNQPSLVTEVIMDGKIQSDHLHMFGKDERWLMEQLKHKNMNTAKMNQIALAILDEQGTLTVYSKA